MSWRWPIQETNEISARKRPTVSLNQSFSPFGPPLIDGIQSKRLERFVVPHRDRGAVRERDDGDQAGFLPDDGAVLPFR